MTDLLSRAAAAIDWRDEAEDESGRAADATIRRTPDAPRVGDTEIVASLRCPVGRLRTGPAAAGEAVPVEPGREPRGLVTAFPGGEAHRACRTTPMGNARGTTPEARRPEDASAGRVRGITDNTL